MLGREAKFFVDRCGSLCQNCRSLSRQERCPGRTTM